MDILLHLGAHRTATTTLQHALGRNRSALDGSGLAYWGPKRLRGGLFDGLYGAGDAASATPGEALRRIRFRTRGAARAGTATLIVSDENMLGTMRGILMAEQLYPDAGARVARFAAGFAGRPVTLGLSVRSYDDFWTSVLAWRLQRGGPLPLPALCERLVLQPRRWRHVVADLAQAMPEARIRVWSHEALAGKPADLVARLTGHRLGPTDASEHCNATPGLPELRRHLAGLGADPDLARGAEGRFMPFDACQRRTLQTRYAEDLAWLSAGAGGLADYLEEAGPTPLRPTGQGRGRPDDRDAGRLAQAG